jgi:hypothetical protein
MRNLDMLCVAFFCLQNCGIEVGNPGNQTGGGKPPQGTLSIFFAKELSRDGTSLALKLQSLDLVAGKGDGELKSKLQAAVDEIDLFARENQDDQLVAESSEIPPGSYDQLSFNLNEIEPLAYTGPDGKSQPIQLDEGRTSVFRLDQEFEISEGKTTSLVIKLDPRRSLSTDNSNGQQIHFRPHGEAQRGRLGLNYSGETALVGAQWVCAFAYAPQPRPRQSHEGDLESRGSPELPHEPIVERPEEEHAEEFGLFEGPRTKAAEVFLSKEAVIKDTQRECPHAYTVVPVFEGKYELRHLVPASYALRIFKEDGTFADEGSDFTLKIPNSANRDQP